MTVKKTHLLRNSIIIMLVFAIAGLALTYVKFFGNPDPTAATATMEFTFEGAADGIAPNGSQFNLSGITNEEVLSAALSECGMAEKYTVGQLQECLVARGVYPDNFVQQVTSYESLLDFNSNHEAANTNYHATTFSVELYNDFDKSISRDQLETLLKAIVSSYKSFFSRAYANGLDRDDLTKLADMDYSHQLDAIETYCNTLAVYAQEMFARRPAFRFEGEGFNGESLDIPDRSGGYPAYGNDSYGFEDSEGYEGEGYSDEKYAYEDGEGYSDGEEFGYEGEDGYETEDGYADADEGSDGFAYEEEEGAGDGYEYSDDDEDDYYEDDDDAYDGYEDSDDGYVIDPTRTEHYDGQDNSGAFSDSDDDTEYVSDDDILGDDEESDFEGDLKENKDTIDLSSDDEDQ